MTATSAGYRHSLALKAGAVIAWGDNGLDQTQVPTTAKLGVTAIAAGDYFSLASKLDGSVISWGDISTPPDTIQDALRSGVVAIAAGSDFGLALNRTGRSSAGATTSTGRPWSRMR